MVRTIALTLFAGLLMGCASSMEVGADFVPEAPKVTKNYKTYDWLPPSEEMEKELRNPILQGRITEAFDGQFKARGYERTTTGNPDFKVSYFVMVEGKMDIGAMNTYYGYDWYGATGMIMYSQTRSQEYDEGTIVLDVVDGATNGLVWRGIARAKVTTSLDPNKRQAQINEAARKILNQFPPK